MPEEVKLIMDDPPCESSEYGPDPHQQHHLLLEREMSCSESLNCSEESTCYKLNGHESVEIIPTRTLKTSVPKPAANPLQFVKIGPCDLYRSAQQQLQKVDEVKKPKKEVKDEIEDWQSNLDNWKCSRRKQQEHIIERVVEVKKLELEEHDRNRKRTKTFSEMMEERTSKGRKLSLPVYLDENTDDLSDLGLSSIKNLTKSSSPIPEEQNEKVDRDSDAATVRCRNDEATYENAIQSYETRMKSLANGGIGSGDGGTSELKSAPPAAFRLVGGPKKFQGRRGSAAKIEKKLGELERVKNRSVSSSDLGSALEANKKSLGIPKVNIFARKEVFEKKSDEMTDPAAKNVLVALSEEVPRMRSIKERLSSLEKSIEEASKPKNTAPLADVSVRDRLSSINEKLRTQSANGLSEKSAPSSAICISVRSPARASQHKSTACLLRSRSALEYESETRPKEEDTKRNEAPAVSGGRCNREYSSSGRSSSSEDYENVAHHHQRVGHHFHHRSLDSLQGHDSPNGFCFERVQSLECVDCCGSNYPASVLSGDTDREDSGIHTADVSSSVSQADDFDLHADSSIDVDVKGSPPTPTSTPVSVIDGAATCRTNVRDSSQSSGCRFRDPFAKGELPPSASEATNVSDIRQCNALSKRGDVSTIDSANLLPPSNNDDLIEVSSRCSFTNALQPCGGTQLDDLRLPTCAADSYEKCVLVDKQNCVANETLARIIRDSDDDSRAFDEISEPLKNCHSMAETLQSIKQSRSVENKSDTNDEQRQHRDENHAANSGPGSGAGEVLHSTEMVIGSESALVSRFRGIENVGGSETNDQYSSTRLSASDVPDGLVGVHSSAMFPFELSAAAAEPPKEKPPPPPSIDNSDNESDVVENCGLRRMDSTKRIKKEIRLKRSSFLGIEGNDDDSYLEPELESVKRPPDMRTFLQEERRLEKLLYRQSICSESDSTMAESRDSGVELDKNHIDEHSWITEDTHSRQDSEIYANTSVASDEEEIIRKEREILEILELEECRNYENDYKNDYGDLGEKLVLKLKELESRKTGCGWNKERENRIRDCNSEEPLIADEQPNVPMRSLSQPQKQRQLQEGNRSHSDSTALSHQTQRVQVRSLQDVCHDLNTKDGSDRRVGYDERRLERDYSHRSSMPNILCEPTIVSSSYHRVPPPIPPNKPSHSKKAGSTTDEMSCPQQMTKQTLQALCAVPRSKIVPTDSWVLSKKKPRQEAYNYQHWLIQEAEHRRITEYHQRHGNDNGHNNYANALLEYIDGTTLLPPNDTTPLDSRSSAHEPGRYSRVHSQMLPSYQNHYRPFVDDKKAPKSRCKPLPDSVIQTLTQRVQNRLNVNDSTNKPNRRENYSNQLNQQEKMLSVSGKKKCSHCGEELGRGAAMIIESLRLFYHIDCFKCCVCCVQLGDGMIGTDVRVRNSKLHCHSCYSNDEVSKRPKNTMDDQVH